MIFNQSERVFFLGGRGRGYIVNINVTHMDDLAAYMVVAFNLLPDEVVRVSRPDCGHCVVFRVMAMTRTSSSESSGEQ